jgi:hypothetical protein
MLRPDALQCARVALTHMDSLSIAANDESFIESIDIPDFGNGRPVRLVLPKYPQQCQTHPILLWPLLVHSFLLLQCWPCRS